ncbi:hypothetical protein BDB01DRAFT_751896 [Pilobolus umbonatus]|nr:hypothetical protein BDB01DRAFT_751896 [Pilobolus umbonatus]
MVESTTNTSKLIPKRIRSLSAKLFLNNNSHTDTKRSSCQLNHNDTHTISNMKNIWGFYRRRCRSSSSASSTSSMAPSNSSQTEQDISRKLIDLTTVTSEFEELYRMAEEEIRYAIDSHGSIYYEEDHSAAYSAVDQCQTKYSEVLKYISTEDAIVFQCQWKADLNQLCIRLSLLPELTEE